ncbi:PAS domain-containing protein [Sphingomonas sp. ASV193]|uniref:PAS domain-containing protein n=1 Tax=Sphingomonas sp. ASV193 TaxID=3144405 RepID=UPI0032E8977C
MPPRATATSADGALSFDFQTIVAIADALPVMVAYCDRDQVYRFCNRPIADWFERPRSAILGHSLVEVMGPTAYSLRKARIAEALAGIPQRFAAEYDHPTRGLLHAKAEYIPHRPDGGAVAGVIMIVQDVTEQKSAELAIRESEARFRRIADSAPAPVWVTRADRSRDFVNQAYADFLGVDLETARTLDWRERIHPDDHDRIVAESIAGEASGEAFSLEGRFRDGNGDYRWLRSVSQPRSDPEGRHNGFIGVASDITLAKQAELELRDTLRRQAGELVESEARFRAMFDTVRASILLLDPSGRIVDINQTGARWRSPGIEPKRGDLLWESATVRPEHRDEVREMVRIAAAGDTVSREFDLQNPAVGRFVLDCDMRPIVENGRVRYLLFEVRDITELKVAQEQLRQSQKMEALGQLTGGIAHDFNNLLTVIVGGLDLITKRIEEPKLLRYAQNALSAAERGARLTSQLLAFSRVQKLEVKPADVAQLVEEMGPLLRNVVGPGIAMQFELAGALPPVMADPTQLEVAILNLAINARDAMKDGGSLTLAARPVTVGANDPELDAGDYVRLSIADTGSGMDAATAARAFEPFFTTKEVGKGTGLGLSMVYGMARQSGGTVRIDSVPGEGTDVSIYLRRAHAAPLAAIEEQAGETLAVRPERRSVLVIDDDPDVRGYIVSTLEERGYSVSEATDGTSGLAAFAATSPDLVVVDYLMPGMTGAEVAQAMLSERPDQKILFVSGYSETEAIRRAAPDAALLTKPFRPAALDRALRELAGRGD